MHVARIPHIQPLCPDGNARRLPYTLNMRLFYCAFGPSHWYGMQVGRKLRWLQLHLSMHRLQHFHSPQSASTRPDYSGERLPPNETACLGHRSVQGRTGCQDMVPEGVCEAGSEGRVWLLLLPALGARRGYRSFRPHRHHHHRDHGHAARAVHGAGGAVVPASVAALLLVLPLRGPVLRPHDGTGSEEGAQTLLDVFTRWAQLTPHKPLLLFGDAMSKYEQVEQRSSQAVRALRGAAGLQEGGCLALLVGNQPGYVWVWQLQEGGCLALLMGSQPGYIWVWLGCAKLGCAVACLSSSVGAASSLRCFQSCAATVLLAAPELKESVEEILPFKKKENIKVYYLSKTSATEGVESFLEKVGAASDEPTLLSWRLYVTLKTPAMYIYTSGTTGLPKAAVINHERIMLACGLFDAGNVTSEDIVYTPSPLYHSSALLIEVHGCIMKGATIVLCARFSASRFWDDCRKYNVTVIQHIGEVLRYLCSVPQRKNDQDHKVRLAIGNGIRADVWREFVRRFGNINILEFYASTEGNISFVNYIGKIGAVRRVNCLQKKILSYELIKYDIEKDEPVRDENGYCIKMPKGKFCAIIIPSGYEGRTGMACIRLKENSEFNARSTYRHVKTHLPNYARPHFTRIKSAIELTATFKYLKTQLMEESFNPAVKDHLYFLDDRENLYVQVTEDIYNSVKNHDLKL
ncbi:LOW QUALITY PROTEIN: long-chain fatty acid transport protein 2-like [Ara ararauna]